MLRLALGAARPAPIHVTKNRPERLMVVPVIDLFAGPGGLGEGFSRESSVNFEIAVSIEKDGMAHETLRLRAAHRVLSKDPSVDEETWALWDATLEHEEWNIVFDRLRETGNAAIVRACARAEHEALQLELKSSHRGEAAGAIRDRLRRYASGDTPPSNAVLIGGPPCQAYSIVGRSRNRGIDGYKAEDDSRHYLYLEYLNVIAEFQPAVFVMENVKGILTSRVNGGQIFNTIMRDLAQPGIAAGTGADVEYVLLPVTTEKDTLFGAAPEDFLVKAEEYGVPQARHRVIVLGIRKDVFQKVESVRRLSPTSPPTVWDVISDLPPVRPRISYRGKELERWTDAFDSTLFKSAIRELRASGDRGGSKVADKMEEVRWRLVAGQTDPGCGRDRLRLKRTVKRPTRLGEWYSDRSTELLANHQSRAHMPSDLVRYLFAAAYGQVSKTSPRLIDFPRCLLPEHENVDPSNVEHAIFKDRFRVQLGGAYGTTVTSHIAKDGHAFIHPQSRQCRSLTVREAARLQTFPDSYVFLGNRTSQYTQVGNAVPPLLAHQIAAIVADVLTRAGLATSGQPAIPSDRALPVELGVA